MNKVLLLIRQDRFRLILLLSVLLLVATILRFLSVAYQGLFLFEFGDESEKYVAARMLLDGKHLYKDIFSHHGPLLYMLAHGYASLIDASQFNFARTIQIGLAVISALSIYFSPVLIGVIARILAVTIYISMLSSVWLVQGLHMLLYHSIAGFLFVIVLSQLALPALLNFKVSYFHLALSTFCMVTAFFTAYVFLPSAVLLFAIYLISHFSYRSENCASSSVFSAVLAGSLIALCSVFLWLYVYGDIKGYVVYHLYFNQKIYSSFLWWLSPASVLQNLVFSFSPDNIIKIAINGLLLCSFSVWLIVFFREKRSDVDFYIKLLMLLAAMYYLNPRGDETFKNGGLLVVSLALLAITLAMAIERAFSNCKIVATFLFVVIIFSLMAVLEITSRLAISSPHKLARQEYSASQIRLASAMSDRYQFIRRIVRDDETMQVLVFGFAEYIYSDRQPSTGQPSYLPWQAAYKRDAVTGYRMDICKDLRSNLPPLIIYDGWKVWDKYQLPEYEPCIMEILSTRYIRLDRHPEFYIQADRFSALHFDQKKSTYVK